jgi:hypothetical protein
MPGDIPPKGGAEKTQLIVHKTVNLDKRTRQGLVAAFAEVVNLGEENINSEERWNCIENICKDCPLDSSEGLCINTTQINNEKNSDKLKWLSEHHNSPIAGHSG